MLITKLVFLIVFGVSVAIKPPGYIEKPKVYDANPPKYKYEYSVQNVNYKDNENNDHSDGQNLDGGSQGHKEIRDGDNTKGNYYVNLPAGQAHADVQYIADDWGYHPIFRYATHDDHSVVTGHFALGHSAVELLNKNNNVPIVGVDSVPNIPKELPSTLTTHTSPPTASPNNGTDDLSSPNVLPNEQSKQQPNGHGQPQRITLFDVDPHARDPQYDPNIDQPQEQQQQQQQQILQYEHQQKDEPLQQAQPQYNPQDQFTNPYQKQIQFFLQPQHQPLLVYHDHPENLQLIELPIQHQPQQYLIPTNMQITTFMQPVYGQESPINSNSHLSPTNNDPVYKQIPEVQPQEIPNSVPQESNNPGIKKLVASTKDLVTGKDVLDINLAAVEDKKNRLFQPAKTLEDQHNAASNGQKQQAVELENQEQQQQQRENHFTSPIIVTDEPPSLSPGYATTTTEYTPHEISIKPLDYHQPQLNLSANKLQSKQQINVQIVDINNGQYLKETTLIGVTPQILPNAVEAPSRIFLKNFKNKLSESQIPKEQQIYSTTGSTTETTSANSIDFSAASPTPILPNFQNLIHPLQLVLNNEAKDNGDCVHSPTPVPYSTPSPPSTISYQNTEFHGDKTFVEVQKSVNIKNVLFKEKESNAPTSPQPEFGARFIPISKKFHYSKSNEDQYPVHVEKQIIQKHTQIDEVVQPQHSVEQEKLDEPNEQPVQVEKQVLVQANYVNQPFHQLTTKIVEKHEPYFVETIVEKPVEQNIDCKVPYPVILEKNVHHPYTIEKVIEKIVDQPVPIGQIIEKEVQVPYRVEKVVERTVEKIIEKPVPFPYPVHVNSDTNRPYPVNGIDEKPFTNNVDHPIDKKNIDHPVPVQVQIPVAVHVPYGVHLPIHVPYTIENEVKIPYHIPYIQSYPPPLVPHHYQHNNIHPNQQHHNKHKHVFLQPPPVHTPHFTNQLTYQGNSLFSSHIQSGNYDKKHIFLNPQISSPQPQKSTILHSVPTSYTYPKPVYGVPYVDNNNNGGGGGGNGVGNGGASRGTDVNAIWGQNIKTKLFTNTDQLQTYAGKYDYQHNLFKDDYHGPPPSQYQQQNLWLYHANHNHLDPLESSESIGLKLVTTANNNNNNNNQHHHQPQIVLQQNHYQSLHNLPQFKQKHHLINNFSDYRRSLNFGKQLRWEYGFKPPLIPSIEIDDHGNPIKRNIDQ